MIWVVHDKWCNWVLLCSASWFHLSHEVYWQCGLQFDPLNPVPVLIFLLSIKGSVCRAQCMFQWLGSLFHISACVVCPMITLPLGAPVSHRDPVSAVVCNLGCFGVLLSIYCYFLAHERHPSS